MQNNRPGGRLEGGMEQAGADCSRAAQVRAEQYSRAAGQAWAEQFCRKVEQVGAEPYSRAAEQAFDFHKSSNTSDNEHVQRSLEKEKGGEVKTSPNEIDLAVSLLIMPIS